MWAVNYRLSFSYDYINKVSTLLIVHSIDMACWRYDGGQITTVWRIARCIGVAPVSILNGVPLHRKMINLHLTARWMAHQIKQHFSKKRVVCRCALLDVSFYCNNIIKEQMRIIKRIAVERGTMLAMVCLIFAARKHILCICFAVLRDTAMFSFFPITNVHNEEHVYKNCIILMEKEINWMSVSKVM